MTASEAVNDVLPVDKHRQRILDHIHHHRVTIVQGETGCGKSTRIPEMIWEAEHQAGRECRMFVSQPRRMAASALFTHMQKGPLGHLYGLRMGHGERIESDDTRIYFVTSGYLVQYMAHNTKAFKFHTHLIIDEVHERSVDSDMLCMLAKHLLVQFRHLRLIVMSATIQSRLYAEYFSVPKDDTLSVGTRRFPIEINYLDEFTKVNLPPNLSVKITQLMDACTRSIQNASMIVPVTVAKLQYDLALLILQKLGTSQMRRSEAAVLIFVSGMHDICDLTEQIENLNTSGRCQIFFKVVPIHSELPFSAQENAWKEVEAHELKVIIATNAAESSVTLPDVDTVICFGTHKQIERVGNSDQTQLINTWIPKSGAVQRAGRTGRKRPGVCYRLYSESIFEQFADYEVPEVKRQPLDQLVLRLRSIMDAPVIPLLETLIEPPSFDAIHAAFSSLYRLRMIEHPSDEGSLTKAGRFVSCLGIDVRSGRLLADSFLLGMMAEAIVIVMSLALQHSPYRIAVPLIHAPTDFNDIVTAVLRSTAKYDDGMLSESMTILELYRDWVKAPSQVGFACENSLSSTRIRQLHSMVQHLRGRVAKELNIPEEQLVLDTNQKLDPKGRLFIRLLLTWTFNDHVLRAERSKGPLSTPNSVLIERSGAVTNSDISNVFKNAPKLKPRLEQVETRVFLAEKISVQQPIACWALERVFRDLRIDFVAVLEDSDVKTFTLFCLPRHYAALSTSFDKQLSGAVTLKRNPKTGEKFTVGTVTIPNNKLYKDFRKHIRFGVRQPSIVIFLGKTSAEAITCRCDLSDGWKHALLGTSSEWTEKHSAISEYIVFNETPSPSSELVQDCTGLGMKTLTSICNGYRGAPLLKVISTTDRTKTIEIPVRTCRTTWSLVADLSTTGSRAKTVMPRNSLLEGAGFLNLNQHPVFAIASNILFFSAGRDMARVDGVTVLPQGEEWLCLALHCVGIECASWLGRNVDSARLHLASEIYQRLKYSSTSLELPDMQLLLDIDHLFSTTTPANLLEIMDDASAAAEAERNAPPAPIHEPTAFHTDGVALRTFEESNTLNITNIAVLTRLREMSKKKGGGDRSYQDGGARVKYVCMRCNMRNSWKKVLTHMQTNSVCRRFVWELVGDIETEFETKEEKREIDPYADRYCCFAECGKDFPDWERCLDHIKSDAMCYQKIVERQHSEREHSGLWKIPIAERLGKSILRDRDMNNMFVCPSCSTTMSWSEMKDHLEYADICAQYVEDVFPLAQRDWQARLVFEGLKERCLVESPL